MKTLKEVHEAAKKTNPFPQHRFDVLCGIYDHIKYILDDQYIDNREEMLAILNFHLKHLAFLVTQDESKFMALYEIKTRFSYALAIRCQGSSFSNDLSKLSQDEYEAYLRLIAETSLEEICK
jgi:hypothetical protein